MHKFDKILSFTTWAYLTATILALGLMYLTGDRWWPGTLLLFGPRWMLALPLALLLPLALWLRPRLLLPLAVAGCIVAGPFMGLRCSFSKPGIQNGFVLRVMTCNAGGHDFSPETLSRLIQDMSVDIVSLQECGYKILHYLPPGWHELNPSGITILSKFPLRELPAVTGMHLPDSWPRHCVLPSIVSTPVGEIAFNAVHFPTARYGIMHMLDRKIGINPLKTDILKKTTDNRMQISQKTREAINAQKIPFIVAGDFNMPVESAIYRQHWTDLTNAFSSKGIGYGFSSSAVAKGILVKIRIDHILTGNGAFPLTCTVGPDVGSDHKIIISDISVNNNTNIL